MSEIKNILRIGNTIFRFNAENSVFTYTLQNNEIISCDIDCYFYENDFCGMPVSPMLRIEEIELKKQNLKDLIGTILTVDTPEKSFEREDFLRIFECEPFEKINIEICEIFEKSLHLKISGVAITDGYSEPYEAETFDLDIEIPISCYQPNQKTTKENPYSKSLEVAKKIKSKALLAFWLNNIILILNMALVQNTVLFIINAFILIILFLLIVVSNIIESIVNKKKENFYKKTYKKQV